MASASKIFIAVAILQLIEGKFIKFESTIGELLPMNWHHIDKSITIRQLLTHTSVFRIILMNRAIVIMQSYGKIILIIACERLKNYFHCFYISE